MARMVLKGAGLKKQSIKGGMIIPVYSKLVRDKIPAIIRATGKECRFSHVSGDDRILALQAKLFEELQEFVDSERNLEELADILEVVDSLAFQLGSSLEEVMERKQRKKDKRGGFEQGIWLEWVED